MLHEFLSTLTDELLDYTEAEDESDITYERILGVVSPKFDSWPHSNFIDLGEKIDVICLLLYRIIKKDMEIPSNCADGPYIENNPGSLISAIAKVGDTLYAHWSQLPLDAQDVKLIKKYLYRGRTVEEGYYLGTVNMKFHLYTGNLGIDYKFDGSERGMDILTSDIVVFDPETNVDDRGVLTINLNRTIFYTAVHYKSLIIKDIQLRDLAKAIWRKLFWKKLFKKNYNNRFKSKITAIRINPCKIYAWGVTQKFIEDNFRIEIGGQSYTISEFIDALTAEFAKILKLSRADIVAKQSNTPLNKNNINSSLGEDLQGNASNTSTGVKSNGIYSVMTGKWIKEPVQADIPDLDKEAFDKVFNEWEDKYFELLKKIGKTEEETSEKEILTESNEDKSELISNFIEDLYDLRKDSIATEGEYGIGNLVFKEFRNLGYLDNLKDLKNEERSKELSLENLNEDIDDDMNTSNDYAYGPAESLPEMTPYMLRQDGALLKCGDIHPYIKMSTKTSYETNLHTLNLHPEFLDWFYENTLDPVTKDLIDKFRKEPTPGLMDVLNDLTNEDFCRVRTSNYKVKSGGKNGQIYFRISSTNFDWFNLIWGVVAKFVHDIDNVTVMKDSQTFGGKEFDYYYDHVPVDEFLTLKGNPEIK